MKNIESIQAEINETFSLMEQQKKEKNRINGQTLKRYRRLQTCKAYLKSKPSEEFVMEEKNRVFNRIQKIFEGWVPLDAEKFTKSQCRDALKKFEKENEIPLLRTQLSTLRFLLN